MNKKKKTKKTRSHRGKLIKGMSKKLPYKILENPVFKKSLKDILKGYAGIYALYKNEKLYYVGLATDLFKRIRRHLKDRHAGKWNRFVIFRIKKTSYLKDIETLVLHIANPPGNKVKGKVPVPKDSDINRILKNKMIEYEKELKEIKKVIKK